MGAKAEKSNGVCFVAMPYGTDAGEQQHYQAWYDLVYEPAIKDVGAKPHPFWVDKSPVSVTKDIFEHLLNDELAIFDLAALTLDGLPNPNVMYELGVRHAFQLPSVIYAWIGHKLPFDVNHQRAVVLPRSITNVKHARSDIAAALKEAREGRFYNPLEGLARAQQINQEAKHDPPLKLLADNISDLTNQIAAIRTEQARPRYTREDILAALDEDHPLRLSRVASLLNEPDPFSDPAASVDAAIFKAVRAGLTGSTEVHNKKK